MGVDRETYADVQRQIAELRRKAEDLKTRELPAVIDKIKQAIKAYDIRPEQLYEGVYATGESAATQESAPRPAPLRTPKFGDNLGNVWGGMGPRPKWLRDALAQGRSLEEFSLTGGVASIAEAPAGPSAVQSGRSGRGSTSAPPAAGQPSNAPVAPAAEQPVSHKPAKRPAPAAAKKHPVSRPAAGSHGAVLYSSGANSWTGRGRRPQWLTDEINRGKKLEDFKV